MTTVNVQGFGAVNFPDSMTPEQISEAIERDILPKMKGAQQPATKQPDAAPQRPKAPPMKVEGSELTWAERNIAPLLPDNLQGSVMGRVVQGAADAPVGLMQLAANALPESTGIPKAVNDRVRDLEGGYQSQRAMAGSDGFDLARLGGNVLGTAPAASAIKPGATLLANLLRGGATGAAFGAASPVTEGDFSTEKRKQVAIGAAGGAAMAPLSSLVASVVSPKVGAAQRKLIDEGVSLTPGQIMGGVPRRVEDALTSVPVVGDVVRNAQRRGVEGLNRAAYARALRGIGEGADDLPVGPEGVLAVKTKLGAAYDALLPKLTFRADKQFSGDVENLRALAGGPTGLGKSEAQRFDNIVHDAIKKITKNGSMDGEAYKLVESELTKKAKAFSKSSDAYQQELGAAITELRSIFKGALERSNPKYAEELAAVNQGWANYTRIRQAAASAGDKSGGFSPAQLAAAVRGQDQSVGKGNVATGKALMQDLSDAARAVLPSQVPDSGTPLRSMVAAAPYLAAGALGGQAVPGLTAGTAAAAGMGALATIPYTANGQKIAQILLAQRPKGAGKVADLLRELGPLAGAASAPAVFQGVID